jgi:hypothetical protein
MTEAPQASPAKDMDLGAYISKAWKLVTADLVLFVVGFLIVMAIIVGSMIVVVGPIFVGGPLMIGFIRVIQKRMNGEPAAIGDIFNGFKDFTRGLVVVLLLLLVAIVVAIPVVIINIVLAFIPCLGQIAAFVVNLAVGLGLGTCLFFVWPLAALTEIPPVDCISKSIKFAFANFGPVLLLAFVAGLIGEAGVIACGIGVLFTVPLAEAIRVAAYNDYYVRKSQAAA